MTGKRSCNAINNLVLHIDTYKGIYFYAEKPTNIEFTEKLVEVTELVTFEVAVDKTQRLFLHTFPAA